uniref:C40 family peptidase n=1 Tax=Marivita sp. TaxID=2003365 RepID=UPI0026303FB4
QEGDIVIFTRGDPSGWQGHVGFFVRKTAASIEVLGGNQADAVNIKRYAKTRLLGIRRAGSVAPAVTLSVRDVQQRLRALGYHEVGTADGILGPRTRAAILAFRQDNALTLAPIIDTALIDALDTAPPREIGAERASGMPLNSRIVTAANTQIGLGTLGALGTLSSQIAPALAEAEGAQGLAHRLIALLGLDGWFPALLPWIGAAVFLAVVCAAWRARAARIEDHRSGKTP